MTWAVDDNDYEDNNDNDDDDVDNDDDDVDNDSSNMTFQTDVSVTWPILLAFVNTIFRSRQMKTRMNLQTQESQTLETKVSFRLDP